MIFGSDFIHIQFKSVSLVALNRSARHGQRGRHGVARPTGCSRPEGSHYPAQGDQGRQPVARTAQRLRQCLQAVRAGEHWDEEQAAAPRCLCSFRGSKHITCLFTWIPVALIHQFISASLHLSHRSSVWHPGFFRNIKKSKNMNLKKIVTML